MRKRNWAQETRLAWIRQMVGIYGYINRHHIQAMFRVTHTQAALDLKAARDEWPQMMIYNGGAKRYEATEHYRKLGRNDATPLTLAELRP